MITVLPVKYSARAIRTRPAFGAATGDPGGLRKSAPPCALRGSPLKMLRVPNALFATSGTGTHERRCPARLSPGVAHTFCSSRASRSIRSCSSGGGFHEGWIDGEAARRKLLGLDLQVVHRSPLTVSIDRGGDHGVGSRRDIEVDADQRPIRLQPDPGCPNVLSEGGDVQAARRVRQINRDHHKFTRLKRARGHR